MKTYGQTRRSYGQLGYGADSVKWCPPDVIFTNSFEDQVSLVPSYVEAIGPRSPFSDVSDKTMPAEPCPDDLV